MLLFVAGTAAIAQQAAIEGQVAIHNSEYITGKVQYVEGAFVGALNTTTQPTDKKGRFQLKFAGVDRGNFIDITVEKTDLEVANPYDIQGVAIGKEAPLHIFLIEKGQLEQAKKELLNGSASALEARREKLTASLRRGGEEARLTLLELEKQLNRKITGRFEGEKLLREQSDELKKRLPETAENLARTNLDLASGAYRQAFELYRNGEMEDAIAALDKAGLEEEAEKALSRLLELERKGKGKQAAEERESVRQAAKAYQLKAQACLLVFQYQDALNAHQKAVPLLEKSAEGDNIGLAEAYAEMAFNYLLLREYANALYYQQRNVKIKERLLGPDAPETASSYNLLADIYRDLEEYPTALEVQQKAIAIQERALPPGHPDFAVSYAGLASIYRLMKEYSMAGEDLQKALAIQERVLPPNHPDVGRSYHTLAEIHLEGQAYNPALQAQLKALFIQERALPPGHPDIVQAYNTLARVYHNLGDYQRALAIQQKVISMQERVLPPGHPDIADSYHNLSSTFYFLNSLDSAIHYEHQSYTLLQEQLPAYHPRIQAAEASFAFLYTTRGERLQSAGLYQEAIKDLRKALEFRPDNEEAKSRIKQMQTGEKDPPEALALRGSNTSRPASQRSPRVPPKTEAPSPSLGTFQVTKATSLRALPTSSSAVINRLAEGDQLQVVEKTEYYWWKVVDKGRVGYVKALLLEKVK